MLILLINGWIGETRLIKRNGGCGYVWEIHHSDDCYSGGRLVVAQTGDSARADTAKTATKRLGTSTGHHRVQTYQIQYGYVMSCSVVSGLGCHANFPLTHPTFGPDILAITRLINDLPFCPFGVGVDCILAALHPAAFRAARRGVAHKLA